VAVAAEQDELLKKIEALEKQLQELKEVQKSSGEKKSQCLKVGVGEKVCNCLAEKLPREVGFEQYVHYVVTPKGGLGYDGLPTEQRKHIDDALASRDACVEKGKGGFLW